MISDIELGKRIRKAREQRGMTQVELGRRLGYTSHVPVANLEGGKTHFTVVELQRIAQILRLSMAAIVPELDGSKLLDGFSVSFRAEGGLLSEEQASIERLYEVKRKEKQDTQNRMLGVDMKTANGARTLARYHLRELGIEKPPVNLREVLLHWNIDYDEVDFGERISGLLLRDWQVRLICVNKMHSRLRKRMTIAHELGHFHIGWGVLHYTTTIGTQHGLEESLAYEYANELLVPSMWLKENKERWERNPVGLALECQISPIALEIWAARVGLPLPLDPEFRRKHVEVTETWEKKRLKYSSTTKRAPHTLS